MRATICVQRRPVLIEYEQIIECPIANLGLQFLECIGAAVESSPA
jgi:hypothetical protein